MKIAFLYEHPTWSDQLIQCFGENKIALKLLNIADLAFDTGQLNVDYDLLINRVNIMPSAGRNAGLSFHTLHFLHWLELTGVPVVNGARAHYAGASKAVQNGIFAKLGLDFPKAVAIHKVADALGAAEKIGFPLMVKPNIGGSGSGVAKYDNAEDLNRGVAGREFDFGVDHSGLVQEYIPSDGFVYRIEILGDRLFYAIKQKIVADQFNYCAADGCHMAEAQPEQGGSFDFCAMAPTEHIEPFEPSAGIVAQVVSVIQAAGADVGGVEFLVNRKTGRPCFYDFNPYSNFVSEGKRLLGFSPEQRYVEFVASRIEKIRTTKNPEKEASK
jgi:Carbamoyl-phosphate synthase L chain, ATP binding domain